MTSKAKSVLMSTAAKASAMCALVGARMTAIMCDDAFTKATKASENLQDKFSDLAKAVFPVAIIVCGLAMLFTRDQKKFDAEKHMLIGCCGAYLLILIVGTLHGDSNIFVTTIADLLK